MLVVSAGELGHPVAHLVGVECRDCPLHAFQRSDAGEAPCERTEALSAGSWTGPVGQPVQRSGHPDRRRLGFGGTFDEGCGFGQSSEKVRDGVVVTGIQRQGGGSGANRAENR